jgi:hypothetical protein
MKKYEQLLIDYADEIEEIKELAKAKKEQLNIIKDIEAQMPEQFDDSTWWAWNDKLDEAYQVFTDISSDFYGAVMLLRQEIEIEYHDVPYTAPRQQGMSRFLELAFDGLLPQ